VKLALIVLLLVGVAHAEDIDGKHARAFSKLADKAAKKQQRAQSLLVLAVRARCCAIRRATRRCTRPSATRR